MQENMYYFRSSFDRMTSLQHLNFSYNELVSLGIEKCSSTKKILKSIDVSNSDSGLLYILDSTFYKCFQFEEVFCRNNRYRKIDTGWKIFHKSLRILDLRQNYISDLSVSTIFLKYKIHPREHGG